MYTSKMLCSFNWDFRALLCHSFYISYTFITLDWSNSCVI